MFVNIFKWFVHTVCAWVIRLTRQKMFGEAIETRLSLADGEKFNRLRAREGVTKSELMRKLASEALARIEV